MHLSVIGVIYKSECEIFLKSRCELVLKVQPPERITWTKFPRPI